MTCFVPSPSRSDHIHFVDGAMGGYAMAAQAMGSVLTSEGDMNAGGDLANWAVPGGKVMGIGGAMDLASGCRRVIAMMQHTTKKREFKLVQKCDYPLTATRVVSLVITAALSSLWWSLLFSLLMLAVAWWAAATVWRGRRVAGGGGTPFSRVQLRLLSAMTFSGWVATVAGWYVTEIGRQPFIVYGLLRTADVLCMPSSSEGMPVAAIDAPIPRAAPVTRAVLPSSENRFDAIGTSQFPCGTIDLGRSAGAYNTRLNSTAATF